MTDTERLETRVRASMAARAAAVGDPAYPVEWFDGMLRGSRTRRRYRAAGLALATTLVAALAALLVPAAVQRHAQRTDITVVPGPHPALGSVVGRWVAGGSGSHPAAASVLYRDGSLWVEIGTTVQQLDPRTFHVRQYLDTTQLSQGTLVPAGGHNLAFVGADGTVTLVDPAGAARPTTTRMNVYNVTAASAFGSIWIASGPGDTVYRMSADTGRLQARVHVGAAIDPAPPGDPRDQATCRCGLRPIAAAGDSVWVGGAHGVAYRIDPRTNEATAQSIGAADITALAADRFGDLWVTQRGLDTVTRLTPSGTVASTVAVDAGPSSLAFYDGALWVGCAAARKVDRIDPSTGKVVARISTGQTPDVIVPAGASLIVGVIDDPHGDNSQVNETLLIIKTRR